MKSIKIGILIRFTRNYDVIGACTFIHALNNSRQPAERTSFQPRALEMSSD